MTMSRWLLKIIYAGPRASTPIGRNLHKRGSLSTTTQCPTASTSRLKPAAACPLTSSFKTAFVPSNKRLELSSRVLILGSTVARSPSTSTVLAALTSMGTEVRPHGAVRMVATLHMGVSQPGEALEHLTVVVQLPMDNPNGRS